MTTREEQILKEHIKNIARAIIKESLITEKAKKKETEKKKKAESDKRPELRQMRKSVIKFLKKDGVNCADYAYRLWPWKDKDSARSYFYKCRDGKPKPNGEPYAFTSKQINKLYSMISSQVL